MRRMFRGRGRGFFSGKRRIIFVLIIFIFLIFFADSKIRPIIEDMAENQARLISTMAINEAVTSELMNQNVSYSDMIRLQRSNGGDISSIETDTVKAAILKATVTTAIQAKLETRENQSIKVPLGSLIGGVLTGRGPKITIKLSLYGTINTDISSEFSSAGINQTRHRIMLNVKTKIYAMIPGYSSLVEISTNFPIAETVIVGKVPEFYAGLGENSFADIIPKNDSQ